MTYNPSSKIPENNRDRQRNNIPNPPRKIEQQEQIPNKPTSQRGPIEPQTPFRVRKPYRFCILIGICRIVVVSPERNERGYGHDVGKGANSCSEEWYGG